MDMRFALLCSVIANRSRVKGEQRYSWRRFMLSPMPIQAKTPEENFAIIQQLHQRLGGTSK